MWMKKKTEFIRDKTFVLLATPMAKYPTYRTEKYPMVGHKYRFPVFLSFY